MACQSAIDGYDMWRPSVWRRAGSGDPRPTSTDDPPLQRSKPAALERGKHADELSGTGEIGENVANEANFAESISIVETQHPIQVTANSGARSRLDKLTQSQCRSGFPV